MKRLLTSNAAILMNGIASLEAIRTPASRRAGMPYCDNTSSIRCRAPGTTMMRIPAWWRSTTSCTRALTPSSSTAP